MSTGKPMIIVSDIPVEIVRKNIKNIHLAIYPPDGKVRISVPQSITDDNVRLAIVSKLSWIKKRQDEFKKQPRQYERFYVSGESHYYQGRRYILDVVERHGKHSFHLKSNARMLLRVNPGTSKENRSLAVNNWYRQQLKRDISRLLEKWQPVIGKEVSSWGVKKMKTKWGSCNIADRRIWINLELAKKSPACLEYILVHELVHLHERHHNDNFKRLMDTCLPHWRQSREVLKSEPLAHEEWEY
ncbi:MAG: M48 family metallopeptidase [Candidatus Thiodiazotropha sp. (ex Codakia orbicularis)]|nr:M48 family metallopeptidase [Candidatus Thiodiazotropha sp. (ex Codakia orbicularis)]